MNNMKSIHFPPPVADDMVRAFLDNRKTVTRRVVKNTKPEWRFIGMENRSFALFQCDENPYDYPMRNLPYYPGDILYVRETWRVWRARRYEADVHIEFKAGGDGTVLRFPYGGTDSVNRKDYDKFFEKWGIGTRWHPSIHMPREVARIFLRVKDVRVERLQGITEDGAFAEGAQTTATFQSTRDVFRDIWNSTIKKSDRALYGWEANPWVWAIEFEKISREEV